MPLYRYVKSVGTGKSKKSVVLSYVFMATGVLILVWTMWPIVAFSALSAQLEKTVSPVSDGIVVTKPKQSLLGSNDFQNPNTWFPTRPQKKVTAGVNTYTVSIPKLKIKDALVTIAGDDLAVSLVHYGGTPLPGQYGNTVIFGHSTLPQFYSSTNYKTIFSFLPTMKIGDEIMIHFDTMDYRYIVYDMVVVEPTDLSPLEQKFDDAYVTLVTCVPPGTYWKRLNIKARLAKL